MIYIFSIVISTSKEPRICRIVMYSCTCGLYINPHKVDQRRNSGHRSLYALYLT